MTNDELIDWLKTHGYRSCVNYVPHIKTFRKGFIDKTIYCMVGDTHSYLTADAPPIHYLSTEALMEKLLALEEPSFPNQILEIITGSGFRFSHRYENYKSCFIGQLDEEGSVIEVEKSDNGYRFIRTRMYRATSVLNSPTTIEEFQQWWDEILK